MAKSLRVMIKRSAAALLSLAACLAAAVAGFHLWAAQLPPLDLAPTAERSLTVLDRNGVLLRPYTTSAGRWRLPLGVGDVDPRYLDMLIAYEDQRFYRHRGIDFMALVRSAWQLASNGRAVSGGSTLTMQVARLLEPREERNLAAKFRQFARARELERRFSKDDILRLYLSLAPFGGNIEGVRAASLAYFGKEPKRLSYSEAALLVALPQSPELRRPDRHAQAARAARDRVLSRIKARGVITAAEAAEARRAEVPTARRPFPMLAAHASDKVAKTNPKAGVVQLTIDHRLQTSLELLARERASALGPKVSAAIIVVDNATGEIRAHVAGAEFLSSDRAGGVDLTEAIRSPGSALKPFIYALAFESGLAHPETMLADRPMRWSAYAPENFDQTFQGSITARRALQHSLNLPAVELLSEIGPHKFLARLRAAGAEVALPKETATGLAVGLGGVGVKLVDLARLYRGFAIGGQSRPLVLRLGEAPRDEGRPISDPVAAWYIYDILRNAPPPDNASSQRFAFKTGTSYGFRDAWAIGFDRRYTVAVWVGRPDGAPVTGLIGRQVAAPILFDTFARIGGEPLAPLRPAGVLDVTTSRLPPPLRHLRRDVPKVLASRLTTPLKIAYPPEGSRVDLGLLLADARKSPLAIKISGGAPPFIWMVNGAPIDAPAHRRQAFWTPDGAGFARLFVMDSTGASDSVLVRLE